jgi:DNA-binding transcriptional ArsR family regulator
MLIGHSMSDETGRIIAVDQGICEFLELEESELVGMCYTQLTHPDDLTWNASMLDRLENSGGPLTIRKRYLRPSAPAVWSDVQVSRLKIGREQGRLVGTIHRVDPRDVETTPEKLWHAACRIEGELRARRAELGEEMFHDYAWVILLALYRSEAEGVCLVLDSLASRTRIRSQTLVRWLKVLDERGLVDRYEQLDYSGQLTALGVSKVERLLDGTHSASELPTAR